MSAYDVIIILSDLTPAFDECDKVAVRSARLSRIYASSIDCNVPEVVRDMLGEAATEAQETANAVKRHLSDAIRARLAKEKE